MIFIIEINQNKSEQSIRYILFLLYGYYNNRILKNRDDRAIIFLTQKTQRKNTKFHKGIFRIIKFPRQIQKEKHKVPLRKFPVHFNNNNPDCYRDHKVVLNKKAQSNLCPVLFYYEKNNLSN